MPVVIGIMTKDGESSRIDPARVAIWSAFFLAIVLLLDQSTSVNIELYVLLVVTVVVVLIIFNHIQNRE